MKKFTKAWYKWRARKGGKARAEKMTQSQRCLAASKAGKARWIKYESSPVHK